MSLQIKKEVALLMAKGVKPAQIASQLSLSASYISQLAEDEEFKEMFRIAYEERMSRRKEIISADAQIDDYIQKVELAVAKALHDNIAVIAKKPERAINLFKVMNSAKRKTHDDIVKGAAEAEQGTVIQLELPEHIRNLQVKVAAVKNENNEVVQIGDRIIKTTSTAKLFADLESGKIHEQIDEKPALPPTVNMREETFNVEDL